MSSAKKSLGQNFLKSETILKKIRDVADPTPDEITLEIGPGMGSLTEILLLFGSKVIAVEADADLIPLLREKFASHIATGMLDIVHADILQFDETVLQHYDLPYRVVGNIPYYITGAILEKFLSSSYQPQSMTLVMQKEVVDRIMARDGKESILSISIQAYGIPTYEGKIAARYFSPQPKVDSAILRIDSISKNRFLPPNVGGMSAAGGQGGIDEKLFFQIVKAGFAHKRKKLLSNLGIKMPVEQLRPIFEAQKLKETARAEELSIEQWFRLVKEIQKADILSL